MAAKNDVRDLEVENSVFEDGEEVQVSRGEDVGDVAVSEDVARLETEEGGFGNARVRAAKPDCKSFILVHSIHIARCTWRYR